jgi:hypothetical protein
VYVVPVPAASPGTSAAILPPGTYFAERPNGIRLSGWVHSPDASRFPMLKKRPSIPPSVKIPQRDPQLRFVPVETRAGTVTNR